MSWKVGKRKSQKKIHYVNYRVNVHFAVENHPSHLPRNYLHGTLYRPILRLDPFNFISIVSTIPNVVTLQILGEQLTRDVHDYRCIARGVLT